MSALPGELEQALERALVKYRLADMRLATAELSERYRDRRARGSGFIAGELDAAAYAAYRMPATFAAVRAALGQLRRRSPDWSPRSLVDVGAGTGSGLWAATQVWPEIEFATLVDGQPEMLDLGRALCREADARMASLTTWRPGDLRTIASMPESDLVLASYTLNELPTADLHTAIERLWNLSRGVCAIVEPGTPAGFQIIKTVRQVLIAAGAHILAPCPHDDACPMPADDWCHFSVRLPRNRLHREVKPGELGYEDEKFSYVAAARIEGSAAPGRILRHPFYRRGMVRLFVCGADGLATRTVTRRKDRQLYRMARDASWGDEFPPSSD